MNSLRLAIILLLWGGSLYAVLQVGAGTDEHAHSHSGISICGPWGCGPPVQTLASWHGFWLVFATLPLGLLILSWPAGRLKRVGLGLTAAGFLGVLAVVAYEAITWLPDVSGDRAAYFVQRCLFSMATLTDVPLMPVAIGGIAVWSAGIVKSRKEAIGKRDAVNASDKCIRDGCRTGGQIGIR